MRADSRGTACLRLAGIEAAEEQPVWVVDPFVEVAHHVEDGVVAPLASATRGGARGAEQGPVAIREAIQARVAVSHRGLAMDQRRGVALAGHVANAAFVAVAVRKASVAFAAAGPHPLVLAAQPLAGVAADFAGEQPAQVALR